jgi:hypothetical protein
LLVQRFPAGQLMTRHMSQQLSFVQAKMDVQQ